MTAALRTAVGFPSSAEQKLRDNECVDLCREKRNQVRVHWLGFGTKSRKSVGTKCPLIIRFFHDIQTLHSQYEML